MEACEINPYIRYGDIRICSASYRQPVKAYDYRLFAVLQGNCRLALEDGELSLCKDCCVIIPPATAYSFRFDAYAPCTLCNVNFSLTYLPGDRMPLPPDEVDAFEPARMPEQPEQDLFPAVIRIEDIGSLSRLMQDAVSEHNQHDSLSDEIASALLRQVLLRLLRLLRLSMQREQAVPPQVDRIARYLNEHCREVITSRTLGQMLGYHPFYLNRLFREHMGMTMHKYQINCRIRLACGMLESSMLSIREISDSLGFSTPAYFSETFRQVKKVTPSQYRAGAR